MPLLDSAHSNAISQKDFTRFTAVQIALPADIGGNVNLLDGSGVISFIHNGSTTTFTGKHSVYGTLMAAPDVSTQTADSSPRVDIMLAPPTSAGIGSITAPSVQGSRVYVYEGAVNQQTGLVIGQPVLLWSGRIDTAEVNLSDQSRVVRLETCGALERMFEPQAHMVLSDVWHMWAFDLSSSFLSANVSAMQDAAWGKENQSKIGGGGGSVNFGSGSVMDIIRLNQQLF